VTGKERPLCERRRRHHALEGWKGGGGVLIPSEKREERCRADRGASITQCAHFAMKDRGRLVRGAFEGRVDPDRSSWTLTVQGALSMKEEKKKKEEPDADDRARI